MDVITGCKRVIFAIVSISHFHDASCENIVLWRGHFNATGSEKSVNLSINGGTGLYFAQAVRYLSHSY